MTSQVVVAMVAAVGGVIVAVIQRTSHKQRQDHASTAEMVREVRDDLREVKADVRDVRDEVRSHGDRLRNLETMTATQDATDAIVADNARKLKATKATTPPKGGRRAS